jgi:hypothetical protein
MKNGEARNLWVDAQSFLELRLEGAPRKLNGEMHKVDVYYRDYRQISGIKIPFVIETIVEKVNPTRKINIETVTLNPKFDDDAFEKPSVQGIPSAISPPKFSPVAINTGARK